MSTSSNVIILQANDKIIVTKRGEKINLLPELPNITAKELFELNTTIDPKIMLPLVFQNNKRYTTEYIFAHAYRPSDLSTITSSDIVNKNYIIFKPNTYLNRQSYYFEKVGGAIVGSKILLSNDCSKKSTCHLTQWKTCSDNGIGYIYYNNKVIITKSGDIYKLSAHRKYDYYTHRYEDYSYELRKLSSFPQQVDVIAQKGDYVRDIIKSMTGSELSNPKTGELIQDHEIKFLTDTFIKALSHIKRAKTSSDQPTKIDEIIKDFVKRTGEAIRLSEIDKDEEDKSYVNQIKEVYENNPNKNAWWYKDIIVVDIDDQNNLFLRTFSKQNAGDYDDFMETAREFIIPSRVNLCKILYNPYNDVWYEKRGRSRYYGLSPIMIGFTKKAAESKQYGYIKEIYDFMDDHEIHDYYNQVRKISIKDRYEMLFKLLADKQLEKVMKSNISDNTKEYIYSLQGHLSEVYGKTNKLKKADKDDVYKYLGINKYMLDNPRLVERIKFLSNRSDIRDVISKELFNKMQSTYTEDRKRGDYILGRGMYQIERIASNMQEAGATIEDVCEILNMFMKNTTQHEYRSSYNNAIYTNYKCDLLECYSDYLLNRNNLIRALMDRNTDINGDGINATGDINNTNDTELNAVLKHYPIRLKTTEEITRLHDEVSRDLARIQQAVNMEKWNQVKVILEKWNWESDNKKYVIKAPDEPADLAIEGTRQSICIGGYQDRLVSGNTKIFFIRKSDNIKEPYFAIEVNRGRVIQIHGKYNRWLGNIEDDEEYNDVITMVLKWLKKFKITCDQDILNNASRSYCSCSERRAWNDNIRELYNQLG